MLRALVDPNKADTRATPRDERDLIIAANNGWVIALDNLSRLPEWLSDALCRLSTGAGFATRELYSDADEAIFAAQRPIMLNGIEELATRGDLLDRSVVVRLPQIEKAQRRDEKALWQAIEHARPRILGALLDIVSSALRNLPDVHLDSLPRMADFAHWAVAAAPACGWRADDFLEAYAANREEARAMALEGSSVAELVESLWHRNMFGGSPDKMAWQGTATELLQELKNIGGAQAQRRFDLPRTPQHLSNDLRRLAPYLREAGIEVRFGIRRHGGRRIIEICGP